MLLHRGPQTTFYDENQAARTGICIKFCGEDKRIIYYPHGEPKKFEVVVSPYYSKQKRWITLRLLKNLKVIYSE